MCMCIYVHACMYVCVCVCVCIYRPYVIDEKVTELFSRTSHSEYDVSSLFSSFGNKNTWEGSATSTLCVHFKQFVWTSKTERMKAQTSLRSASIVHSPMLRVLKVFRNLMTTNLLRTHGFNGTDKEWKLVKSSLIILTSIWWYIFEYKLTVQLTGDCTCSTVFICTSELVASHCTREHAGTCQSVPSTLDTGWFPHQWQILEYHHC